MLTPRTGVAGARFASVFGTRWPIDRFKRQRLRSAYEAVAEATSHFALRNGCEEGSATWQALLRLLENEAAVVDLLVAATAQGNETALPLELQSSISEAPLYSQYFIGVLCQRLAYLAPLLFLYREAEYALSAEQLTETAARYSQTATTHPQ